uniref:armadillo-like helical domain-containing protein 3 n=1 Tax=Ciona intestinalis TaxID=7719 RepID=UPI000180C654|nr:armadillo-like helical domain-containing protein 3 [Ciona intestinalis]|eukprot:XP_002131899.1 armadillo-like helical domain-containing protein 3 [Ciona intestinalis]
MLRRGSEGKKPLKEKVLLLYDAIFKAEDISLENPNFWDEFFLLRANTDYLEKKLEAMTIKDLLNFKEDLNRFFAKCAEYIMCDYLIRKINSLQTMSCLFRIILSHDLGDHGFEVIDLLVGFGSADVQMQLLLRSLTSILTNTVDGSLEDEEEDLERNYPPILKTLALQLLLIISTGRDNVSQNTFLEYVMLEEEGIEAALVEMLADPVERSRHGVDIILLLTLLVNYRKYESVNPYIMKLSILDNELALNGLSSVISMSLATFNNQFTNKQEESKSSGLFSTITNMVGSMFIGDSDVQKHMIKSNEAILLALYEAVHLNRNFISVLTHSHPDALMEAPPTTPKGGEMRHSKPNTPTMDSVVPIGKTSNVLCTFIQYTSIIMQDTKVKQNISSSKLCFIILSCITEDQLANSFLHDANMIFHIPIHRMPMRHRKARPADCERSRPLACWLFDLTSEFLVTHMMKDFPFMQHMRCIGIIHRLMCYEKKCQIRLQYHWKELWSALLTFLKFVLSNENSFIAQWKNGVFVLLTQIVNLFNMFVTFGDTFLPSPTSYDELYYEIVRMSQIFDTMYTLVLRYINHPEYKEFASKLNSALVNIRAIILHFRPKIDKYSKDNNQATLTEEEVLEVVRNNYDSLTLRLQDNLDHFERYSERPKEVSFFSDLVRSVVQGYRRNVIFEQVDLQKYSST